MRIGEALALTAEDFWFDGEVWRVKVSKSYLYDFKLTKSTKNGKIREIPLTEEVNEARSEIATATEQIFDFSPQAAREMLHKICDEAGLPRYRLHDFRHTFVSNLMRENVPLAVVAEVSGDIQATLLKRYSHMFPSDERLVLDALTCASGHAAKPTRHPKTERLFPAISRDD